jgi:hypothetical protein
MLSGIGSTRPESADLYHILYEITNQAVNSGTRDYRIRPFRDHIPVVGLRYCMPGYRLRAGYTGDGLTN